jgi:hypothetical protein
MSPQIVGIFFGFILIKKGIAKNDFFTQKTIPVSQVFNKINY